MCIAEKFTRQVGRVFRSLHNNTNNTNTRHFYSAKIKIFYCALQTHIANIDIKTNTSNQIECTFQDRIVHGT
jgi:hypothetical protein